MELSNPATQMRVPAVVTNDVLFHEPRRRTLQDVVTCVRHGCAIDEFGRRRERHADRYLKAPLRTNLPRRPMDRPFENGPVMLADWIEREARFCDGRHIARPMASIRSGADDDNVRSPGAR